MFNRQLAVWVQYRGQSWLKVKIYGSDDHLCVDLRADDNQGYGEREQRDKKRFYNYQYLRDERRKECPMMQHKIGRE